MRIKTDVKKIGKHLAWAIFAFLAPSSHSLAEPLPVTAAPAASPAILLALSTGEAALSAGLAGVAALQYEQVLRDPALPAALAQEAVLGLASARLAAGRWAEAEAVLASRPTSDPRVRLRLLLARLHRPNPEALRSQIEALDSAGLPPADLPWWHLVRALGRDMGNDPAGRDEAYREAERLAQTAEQKSQFQLLLYRSQLRRGSTPSPERLDALREQKDRERGRPAGFGFAKIYAIELQRAGKTAEAVAVLEDAVGLASSTENGARGDLRLLLALVHGPEKASGQKALDDILKDQNLAPQTQRLALNLLVSSIGGDGANEKVKKDLRDRLSDKWNTPSGLHPLSDEIRERLSFIYLVDNQLNDAKEILAAWETSVRERLGEAFAKDDSRRHYLRQLSLISWQRGLFKEAAVALGELRALLATPGERARFALLQGDAHFKNTSFTAAAESYASAWADARLADAREILGPAYRQRIQALLEASRQAVSAARLASKAGRVGEAASRDQEATTLLAEAASWADSEGPRCPDLSARWQAEWNLSQRLRASGQNLPALERVNHLAGTTPADFPAELRARLLWLQAELTLESSNPESVPELVAKLRLLVAEKTSLFENSGADLLARSALLEGRALLKKSPSVGAQEAAAVFAKLRGDFPKSDSAAESHLVETRFFASQNQHLKAEASVNALRDDYPDSPYTPIALYEGAILRERRGLAGQAEPGSGGGIYEGALQKLNKGTSPTPKTSATNTSGVPEKPKEDPQHPRVLLRELVSRYKEHPLAFYALLKLANYARSNASFEDYGDADKICDQILENYPGHYDLRRAEMTKADCQFALGGSDPLRYAEAFARYERLHDNTALPDEFRIEAGCKMVETARAQGDRPSALRLAETVVQNLDIQEPLRIEASTLGVTGRYWLSRVLFVQADQLELDKRFSEAQRAYDRILHLKLPGSPLATASLQRLRKPAQETEPPTPETPGKPSPPPVRENPPTGP